MTDLHFQRLCNITEVLPILHCARFALVRVQGLDGLQVSENWEDSFSFASEDLLDYFLNVVKALLGHHGVVALEGHSRIHIIEYRLNARPGRVAGAAQTLPQTDNSVHALLREDILHTRAEMVHYFQQFEIFILNIDLELFVEFADEL